MVELLESWQNVFLWVSHQPINCGTMFFMVACHASYGPSLFPFWVLRTATLWCHGLSETTWNIKNELHMMLNKDAVVFLNMKEILIRAIWKTVIQAQHKKVSYLKFEEYLLSSATCNCNLAPSIVVPDILSEASTLHLKKILAIRFEEHEKLTLVILV